MKKILLTLLHAAFLSSVATALPFQQIIGEDAELLLSIQSLSDLREQWSENPVTEVFRDDALIEMFKGGDPESVDEDSPGFFEELKDDFELTEDEFFELFPGQVSLAVYNLYNFPSQNEKRQEFIFMTEFSGDEERLNALMQVQFERNAESQKAANPLVEHELVKETFMGETLHFDETFNGEITYVEDGYALVDGIVVLATPESRLRQAVEMIKEGQEAPISDLESYQRSRDYSGQSDVSLYLNLSSQIETLNSQLKELPIYNALTLFGITSESLGRALSLEVLQGLFVDFDMVEDGILSHCGVLYSEKKGLLSLLAYTEGELPEARYVPDDVLSSSVTLFDISALYSSLEQLLGTASPSILSMIDIQMQTVQANTGVDLRSGLFENFGTQIVGFAVLKEDAVDAVGPLETEQVVVFDIKDAEAFSQALNALIDSAPALRSLIEENTFEGETTYSIVAPNYQAGTEIKMSYAITRSKFILTIGHVGLLHNVLSEMKNESDGFWQNADVLALFERIQKPNAVTRTYYDAEQLIEPFFKMLSGTGGVRNASDSLQDKKIPESLKGSYRLVAEANEASDGLFWRTLIIKSGD